MHDAWLTANAVRASARRPSAFWVAWSHARTRRWPSGRSPSPVTTFQCSERDGLVKPLRPEAVCVFFFF